MMNASDAPKAGALPGCATPRTAEALRFRPDEGQAESDFAVTSRENGAGTPHSTPVIVPEDVSDAFHTEAITVSEAWRRYHDTLPLIELPPRNIQALRDGKSYVYFIGGEGTPIKIGFSNQPHERLSILQTALWCRLAIIAQVEGSLEDESAYHRRFAPHRMQGEWFAPHPDILAEIDRINAEAVA